MSPIKGGHAEVAAKACSSIGDDERAPTALLPVCNGNKHQQPRRQIHQKFVAAYRRAPSGLCCIASRRRGSEPSSGQRLVRDVRLLSIVALIVISMFSRECTARAFLGMQLGAGGNANQQQPDGDIGSMESFNNAESKSQQQQQQVSVGPLELDYAIELGCRNLVESILYSQLAQPKDQRAALEFLEFMGDERIKRFSPKHTPRFGR